MSRTDRDVTRVVRSWLDEGVTALPDRVLDAVLDQLPATPQRRSWWTAWRTPIMNKFLAIGLGAAAVVVALFIGAQLVGPPAVVGPPTETPSPTEPEPSVEPSSAAGLPEGPHFLWDELRVRIDVTIPAPGWFGEEGGGILVKNDNPDPPEGAGMIVFVGPLYVYGDPCRWSATQADTPATTVDELVAALSAQASRDATAPVDVTVDGFTGKSITLHVPDDADFSVCDADTFGSWTVGPGLEPHRYHQGPGQIDELWILDVNGVPVIIDTAYYADTPTADIEELRAIVESATFQSR